MAFFKDIHVLMAMGISFLILAIALAVVYVNFADVNYLLVIHFDAHRGIDLFGEKDSVYAIWFSGIFMVIVNFLLVSIFYDRHRFAAYLLAYSTAVLSILIFVAVSVIISVN